MINTVMKSILKYWSRDTACHYLGLAAGTPNKITAARSLVLLLQFMIMITPETWGFYIRDRMRFFFPGLVMERVGWYVTGESHSGPDQYSDSLLVKLYKMSWETEIYNDVRIIMRMYTTIEHDQYSLDKISTDYLMNDGCLYFRAHRLLYARVRLNIVNWGHISRVHCHRSMKYLSRQRQCENFYLKRSIIQIFTIYRRRWYIHTVFTRTRDSINQVLTYWTLGFMAIFWAVTSLRVTAGGNVIIFHTPS